jgi:hypothetical protein
MDPFEKQSHVNKLFKKELIVAILWNARRSTESRALSHFPSLREVLREQSGISKQIQFEFVRTLGWHDRAVKYPASWNSKPESPKTRIQVSTMTSVAQTTSTPSQSAPTQLDPAVEAAAFKRLYPRKYLSRFLEHDRRPDGRPTDSWREVGVNAGKNLYSTRLLDCISLLTPSI